MGGNFLTFVPKKGMLFRVQVTEACDHRDNSGFESADADSKVSLGKDGNYPARWSNQNRPEPGPE